MQNTANVVDYMLQQENRVSHFNPVGMTLKAFLQKIYRNIGGKVPSSLLGLEELENNVGQKS